MRARGEKKKKKIKEKKGGLKKRRKEAVVQLSDDLRGNAFEASRKRVRKVDGCSRERAQYSEPTTTTVRNLKRKEMK